jgi:hypothetical protein
MQPALNRADLLRQAQWRAQIKVQVVNTDIDGLMTGALLFHARGWQIVGLYDLEHLWLAEEWVEALQRNLEDVIWVDIDMCWPGTRSLGQHVTAIDPADRHQVAAFETTLNPSLAGGHFARGNYANKYPFGTFQWAWWLLGLPPPESRDVVRTGLVWMPDGGFRSANNRFADNCRDWAQRRMPKSPLGPLVDEGRVQEAPRLVDAAARYIQERSGVRDNWRELQYAPTRTSPRGVIVLDDPTTPGGAARYNAVLGAIADAFAWEPARLPTRLVCFEGTWRRGQRPPPGWPTSANNGKVVSAAVTRLRDVAYTLPDARAGRHSIREALDPNGYTTGG